MAHLDRAGGIALLLQGPNGVGKDEIQRRLEVSGLFGINTGAFMRELAISDPAVACLINEGNLVPSDLVYQFVTTKLHENGNRKPVVLNGAPRENADTNGDQCDQIHRILWGFGFRQIVVIIIDAPDSVLEARRFVRVEKATAAQLPTRPDDQPEIFAKRLRQYRRFGCRVPKLLGNKPGVIVAAPIDGNRTLDQVFESVRQAAMNACGNAQTRTRPPTQGPLPEPQLQQALA